MGVVIYYIDLNYKKKKVYSHIIHIMYIDYKF